MPHDERGVLDTDLVRSAAGGDEQALRALVSTHSAGMARLAFAILGDAEQSKDAVQLAWEIAWRKLSSLRDPTRVRSWLLVLAANEARRLARRTRTRRTAEAAAAAAAASVGDIERAERWADLERALARLDPSARELLGLRFGLGMRSADIAEHLGSTPNAVRLRLTRVVSRLRTELQMEDRDG